MAILLNVVKKGRSTCPDLRITSHYGGLALITKLLYSSKSYLTRLMLGLCLMKLSHHYS